jgi:hypothetical protein
MEGVVLMTELEFRILNVVESNSIIQWIDLLNALHQDSDYQNTDAIAKHLLSNGVLEKSGNCDNPPFCQIQLSDKGRYVLFCEESLRAENITKEQYAEDERNRIIKEEAANSKKEKRSDRCFQLVLALLQTFLSFVAGILVEYHSGITEFIIKLFAQ